MFHCTYFEIIKNLNYQKEQIPYALMLAYNGIEILDYNNPDMDTNHKALFGAKADHTTNKVFQFFVELENDDKNTLGFDLEAMGPDKIGYTQLALSYQGHKYLNYVSLYYYYGDMNNEKNSTHTFTM